MPSPPSANFASKTSHEETSSKSSNRSGQKSQRQLVAYEAASKGYFLKQSLKKSYKPIQPLGKTGCRSSYLRSRKFMKSSTMRQCLLKF